LVHGKDIAIIETKYKDYNHHLGLASFNISEDVKKLASKNNIILLQRKDDIIETILPQLKPF